jgi:hypothetical protein
MKGPLYPCARRGNSSVNVSLFFLCSIVLALSFFQASANNGDPDVFKSPVSTAADTVTFPFGENTGYYGNQFTDQNIYDLMYTAGARVARPFLSLQQWIQYGITPFAAKFNYPYQTKGMRNNVFTFYVDPYGGAYTGQSTFITAGGNQSMLPASLWDSVFTITNGDTTINTNNLYASYVASVYTATQGSYTYFEPFNEPDLNNDYVNAQYDSSMGYYNTWATVQPSPDQTTNTYDSMKNVVRLYQITYQTIHFLSHHNPAIQVCTGGISLRYWLRQFLKAGGGKWIDNLSIHNYPYYYWAYWTATAPVGSGNQRYSDMLLRVNDSVYNGMQVILGQNGISPNLNHCITETNEVRWNYDTYTVAANPGSVNKVVGNDHVQRNYMLKGVADFWRKGFLPIVFYETGDAEDSGVIASGDYHNAEGIYENLDTTQSVTNAKLVQSGVAIQTMQRLCGNYSMAATQPTFAAGVDGIALDSAGYQILMLWTQTNVDSTEVPSKLLTYNLGTTVYKEYIWDGSSPGTATGTVTLSGDPYFFVQSKTGSAVVANAGANQTITLPTNSVSLNGSKSTVSNSTISSYAWTEASGPNTATLSAPTVDSTIANGLIQGTYTFSLKVKDANGDSSSATVTVTINPAASSAPVVSAGSSQTITLPVNSLTLTGTATDLTGTIVSYSWTQSSGPNTSTMSTPTALSTGVSGLVAGTYVFQLNVTNNSSLSGLATVTITVNPAASQAPVVSAGNSQTITLPTNTVTLTGTATDASGTITTYGWTQVSGPSTATFSAASAISSSASGLLAGTYIFSLKVTNNSNLSSSATVTVTVNPVVDQPPTVNAGASQTITMPTNTVSLSATAKDSTGTIITFSWTQVSGPGTATINSAAALATSVTAMVAGTYVFQIKVTDNNNLSATSTVTITVNPAASQAPVVSAGNSQTITLPTSTVTLAGTATDAAGTITTYGWTQVSGPNTATFGTASAISSSASGLVAGTYIFSLKVTNNSNLSSSATVTITVKPVVDEPPTVNAGASQTITLPTNTVSLSATAKDSTGTIITFSWTQVSGPGTATINSAAALATSVTALVAGTYVFQIKVTDNNNLSATSTVTITVNPAASQAPVVSAGNSQTITLPTNTVTLAGTATDAAGTITTYGWTQVSGPSTATFSTASAISSSVSGLLAGTYTFSLKVTNNSNLSSSATVTVTVNPVVDQPPTVNAGASQTITLPTNTVSLSATAKDSTGTIITFSWTQVSGPGTATINSAAALATSVTGLVAGTYVFQIKVTDNNNLSATSTVTIVVNPAPNEPPVVSAGNSQTITLPISSVTLKGTATDLTGTITSYAWTLVSGPGTPTISTGTALTTGVTGLVAGTYVFQLKVSDNNNLSASATVSVLVNPAPNQPPVVSAGSSQSITLPINSAELTGTATDSTGIITSSSWTENSGPNTATISAAASLTTGVSGLIAGTYIFQLKVTDNNNLSATAVVTVTVNPAPNQPPVANAGAGLTITLPVNSAVLDGSKSSDPDGTITVYNWTQVSGPSTAIIANGNTVSPTVSSLVAGVYNFQLEVTDNNGLSATAQTKVIVIAAISQPPVANAGADQNITLPLDSVTLKGTGSQNPNGTIVSYSWTQISGPSAASINSAASVTTLVRSLAQGNYIFKLTVTDNSGLSASDTMTVTVNPAPHQPPVANAGISQTITLPANSATLNGTGSTDPDGTIVSYAWSQVSGPSVSTFTNGNTATASVSALTAGTYIFQLLVTDNDGASSSAEVKVTVSPATSVNPIANAGANQTITLPLDSVTLNGSASSDPSGTIVSYNWTKSSGPGSGTIASVGSTTTLVNNLTQGVYIFKLTVTNNTGNTSVDSVTITVNAAVNIPPVANAGSGKSITLPTDSLSLNGTGSYSPDGIITAYSWVELSGPSTAVISNGNTATASVSSLIAGVYIFQLTVTDNTGASAKASVKITVDSVAIIPPVANAGSDQTITLPLDSVTLNGNGSVAPGGTIVSYQWTKLSGPSSGTIVSSGTVSSLVTNLSTGEYVFQLTIKSNSGATATDTMSVLVKAAANLPPVANAGTNATITLPANSVSLNGSASSDPDGTISSYKWVELFGPSTAIITNSSTATPTVSTLIAGNYIFQLTVTDNNGASSSATVTVKVNPAPNQPPVVSAGSSQTITLPTNSVTLSGTATDATGTIVSYIWTEVSGPNTATLGSASALTTVASGLVAGTYVFQIVVKDDNNLSAVADVTITVNPTVVNESPIANAGNNQTITLPQDSATLSGSNSTDPDGSIVSYNWSLVSGPGTATLSAPSSVQTTVSGLENGSYVFKLTVTDNKGSSASANVTITVEGTQTALVSQPLTANAGNDTTIAIPASSSILNGSASTDPNATITSYQWIQVSGPAFASIASDSSAITGVSDLLAGQYVFQLTVKDSKGATATDTVVVMVVNNLRTSAKSSVMLYPNPAQSTINLQLNNDSTGSMKLSIIDAAGRTAMVIETEKPQSTFNQSLNISRLAKGMYALQIVIGTETVIIAKFLKQ